MTGWRAKGDGRLGKITGDNCEEIKYVVELLADTSLVTTERDEALHILALYLQRAEPADDTRDLTTYGDSQERYAAAIAMRRTGEFEPYRYLVDAGSGERIDPDSGELLDEGQERELVIPVGDLQSVARESAGTSLARGWLDARMSELGWRRIVIDGHRDSGRIGRRGPHARIYAYRGVLPDDDGSVTT